jgi:hypothetical protein
MDIPESIELAIHLAARDVARAVAKETDRDEVHDPVKRYASAMLNTVAADYIKKAKDRSWTGDEARSPWIRSAQGENKVQEGALESALKEWWHGFDEDSDAQVKGKAMPGDAARYQNIIEVFSEDEIISRRVQKYKNKDLTVLDAEPKLKEIYLRHLGGQPSPTAPPPQPDTNVQQAPPAQQAAPPGAPQQ